MVESDDAQGRERRWMLWLALGGVGIAVAGAAAGALIARSKDPEPVDAGAGALFIGIAVGVTLVTVALAFGFVVWRRRRGSALFARSPLWELPTQKQRSRLVRDLRRGRSIEPEQRDLAMRTARDLIRRRGVVWLYLGLSVLQGVNAVLQDGSGRWFYLAGALLFLAVAGYWAWLVQRMRLAVRRLETES